MVHDDLVTFIFEKVMRKKGNGYLVANMVLGRATPAKNQSNLFCQNIADSLDDGSIIYGAVIDFCEAFDLVPHDRLIEKLDRIGFDKKVLIRIVIYKKSVVRGL